MDFCDFWKIVENFWWDLRVGWNFGCWDGEIDCLVDLLGLGFKSFGDRIGGGVVFEGFFSRLFEVLIVIHMRSTLTRLNNTKKLGMFVNAYSSVKSRENFPTLL